jgi:hypothetical protein
MQDLATDYRAMALLALLLLPAVAQLDACQWWPAGTSKPAACSLAPQQLAAGTAGAIAALLLLSCASLLLRLARYLLHRMQRCQQPTKHHRATRELQQPAASEAHTRSAASSSAIFTVSSADISARGTNSPPTQPWAQPGTSHSMLEAPTGQHSMQPSGHIGTTTHSHSFQQTRLQPDATDQEAQQASDAAATGSHSRPSRAGPSQPSLPHSLAPYGAISCSSSISCSSADTSGSPSKSTGRKDGGVTISLQDLLSQAVQQAAAARAAATAEAAAPQAGGCSPAASGPPDRRKGGALGALSYGAGLQGQQGKQWVGADTVNIKVGGAGQHGCRCRAGAIGLHG